MTPKALPRMLILSLLVDTSLKTMISTRAESTIYAHKRVSIKIFLPRLDLPSITDKNVWHLENMLLAIWTYKTKPIINLTKNFLLDRAFSGTPLLTSSMTSIVIKYWAAKVKIVKTSHKTNLFNPSSKWSFASSHTPRLTISWTRTSFYISFLNKFLIKF